MSPQSLPFLLISTSDLSQQTQKTNKQTNKRCTVNFLYSGHLSDLELVSSIARARNGGSLFQSNIRDLFLPRIWLLSILSGCPLGESWLYFCRPGNTSAFTGLWPHPMYIKDQNIKTPCDKFLLKLTFCKVFFTDPVTGQIILDP